MIEVDPDDYDEAGAALPVELQQALARDVGLTGAEWLAQSDAANAAADVVADLNEVIEVVDARLEGYDLVVTVETSTDARIAQLVGARVEFGSAPESRESEPIEGLEPAADLRGGMPYNFFEGAGEYRCSIGFVGLDTDTEQLQIMSAGHCEGNAASMRTAKTINRPTISGGTITSPNTTIGNAGLHVTDEYANPDYPNPGDRTFYDLGMTPVTNGTWVGKPEIVTWGNSTSGAPLASTPLTIRDAGPTVVGATLCKSGSTTGWTCGAVTAIDVLSNVGGNQSIQPCYSDPSRAYCVGSIQASICVRGGDSGGAAVVGSRAVGITSAATNSDISTCSVSGNLGVFATLYSSNPAWEQVTKIYPDWEPLIGFGSKLTNAKPRIPVGTTTLPAQVIGGSTRHSVQATIDGGAPQAATVAANGNWGVPIGSLLGTHTWSATASWGSQTQATPSTGTFLRADEKRLAGSDRYQTALEISKYTFACGATHPAANTCSPGTVPVVYIANGLNFPDALSAGPAATLEGGPLLLTSGVSVSSAVAAELNRLNPDKIIIVGSAAVVSQAVENTLVSFTSSNNADDVIRLGGSDRYETSRMITQRLIDLELVLPGTELWLATGRDYPDALSAGAAAAAAGMPILLVDGKAAGLNAVTSNFIGTTLDASKVYIAGSSAVMSSGIQSALATLLGGSSNVQRAGGTDRFHTSLLINQIAYPESGPDVAEVYLTYGFNFPDALAGGVLAGLVGGPLYISKTTCVAPTIVDHVFTVSPSKVVVFGSTAVVSDAVRDLTTC